MREELVEIITTAEFVETKQNSLVSLYRCIDGYNGADKPELIQHQRRFITYDRIDYMNNNP